MKDKYAYGTDIYGLLLLALNHFESQDSVSLLAD